MLINKRTLLSILLSLILLNSTLGLNTSVSEAKTADLGTINIGSGSSVSLTNVQLMPHNDQQVLSATIRLDNEGTRELAFVDYWVKFKLNNGSVISPTLASTDKAKDKILPGTSQSYTFFTTVNNGTKYSDVSVQIIEWDFDAPDFQRVLGSIKVPANYNGKNQSGQTFTYGNTDIKVDFEDIFNISIDKKNKIRVTTLLTNTSTRSVILPALKFFLVTADGTLYQMTSSKSENITLQPKLEVETELSVEIPVTLNSKKMSIIIAYSEETSKLDIPLKYFELNMENASQDDTGDSVPAGTEKTVLIGDYKYGITLQSVQRLPWEDDDILTANITLSNKNNEAVPIPDLSGVFYLDKVKLKEDSVKKIQVNNLVAIPVNGKVEYLIYTKIPFNNTMNKLGIDLINNLSTGSSSTEKVKVVSFEISSTAFKQVSKVVANSSKKMTTLGKSTTLKINSVNSYDGNSTRIYNILLEAQNDEKRMTTLNKLSGYLKTTNQAYFPVKISEIKEKVSPSGKVLYSIHAKLPTNYNTNGMTLVLGELIDNDSAYNNVTEFILPSEQNTTVSGELKDIPVYPYKLSIDNIKIALTNNATVRFQYTLTKEQQYEIVPEGHSIVMELVDDKQQTSYFKEFKLEQDLQLGTLEQTMVASMNIENPAEKIQQLDGFTIKIYDQFESHKKLLANRKIYAIYIE